MNSGALKTGQEEAPERAASRRWVFGPAMLDERTLELTVAGENIRLERKPLDVLLYLLHHAGEVVTKDELLENLWPGRILSDTVLTRHISVLRQALKDEEHTLIRTAHGFGYCLDGEVKVIAASTPAPPVFKFNAGDSPPQRPHWKLVERLGTGGHGEAWLARHEKTNDARVFKFALDERAVASLKREITLYRVLHDSLGARAAVARILEWNLEEAPYFLEIEYVAGRDLRSWLESQGGVSALPLPARLELVAQIADALAAAHSVGVLHKDLKPGNILIETGGQQPSVKLGDFGCGGVLDERRLEELGITRLGFTKTQADIQGTPLYIAPEVMAGQPFTVKADVYALGVLLYQLLTGDLRKPLAAGWELDVSDELLRKDVMDTAAGNPLQRLESCGELAERLRGLESRRRARLIELETQRRAQRMRATLQKLRRARRLASVFLSLCAIAVLTGISAYRARGEAMAATATANAVSTFLMEDVLTVDRSVERPRSAPYESLLDRASSQVDARFTRQPEAAATIHWLLARRYQETEQIGRAAAEYERAATLFEQLHGPANTQTLLSKERLASIYVDAGRRQDALILARAIRDQLPSPQPKVDLSALIWHTRVARIKVMAGELESAEQILRDVLDNIPYASVNTDARNLLLQWVGFAPKEERLLGDSLGAYTNAFLGAVVLAEYGDRFKEAEAMVRKSLAQLVHLAGANSEVVAFTRFGLGFVLAQRGNYEEAEAHLSAARAFYETWLPRGHFYHSIPQVGFSRLRLEQQRPKEALDFAKEALAYCTSEACTPRVRAELTWDLGKAYAETNHIQEALAAFQAALPVYESVRGPNHIGAIRIRASLADALMRTGRTSDARETLAAIRNSGVLARYPGHPVVADYHRLVGLLALESADFARATSALTEVVTILDPLLGTSHWRTQRARNELAMAQAASDH